MTGLDLALYESRPLFHGAPLRLLPLPLSSEAFPRVATPVMAVWFHRSPLKMGQPVGGKRGGRTQAGFAGRMAGTRPQWNLPSYRAGTADKTTDCGCACSRGFGWPP